MKVNSRRAKTARLSSKLATFLTMPHAMLVLVTGSSEMQAVRPHQACFVAFLLTFVSLAFIDPFFSSGVHLAVAGGLSAAATIAAEIRGQCTPEEAEEWHTTKIGTSYVR